MTFKNPNIFSASDERYLFMFMKDCPFSHWDRSICLDASLLLTPWQLVCVTQSITSNHGVRTENSLPKKRRPFLPTPVSVVAEGISFSRESTMWKMARDSWRRGHFCCAVKAPLLICYAGPGLLLWSDWSNIWGGSFGVKTKAAPFVWATSLVQAIACHSTETSLQRVVFASALAWHSS